MQEGFAVQLLTTVLFQLPIILVYVIGLALLVTRRAGRPRSLALFGLALLLLVVVSATALSLLPMWLLAQGAGLGPYSTLFAVLRAVIGLASAAGVLLLVLALRFALPPR